jgi:hypothetical protein
MLEYPEIDLAFVKLHLNGESCPQDQGSKRIAIMSMRALLFYIPNALPTGWLAISSFRN